jgi:S-adenosylmethionine hydrolase
MSDRAVVLLTDFGNSPYPGIMKGVIKDINPEVSIIDLSHNVSSQAVREAAFILLTSYKYFPNKSILVCVVDPGVGSVRKIILAETEHYCFIAPDNGLLSPVLEREPSKRMVSVENSEYFLKPVSRTFHGRDIFAPVSAHLSLGKDTNVFGRPADEVFHLDLGNLQIKDKEIRGEIVFVDSFGNLVTNIPEDVLKGIQKRRIFVCIDESRISGLKESYTEVQKGEPLAIFGSFGYLELSVREGKANKYFTASEGTEVILEIAE